MLPDREIGILTATVLGAIELAANERVDEGYQRLSRGLRRAEAARDRGESWAAELAIRYRDAIGNYCRRYSAGEPGPPRQPHAVTGRAQGSPRTTVQEGFRPLTASDSLSALGTASRN